MRTFRPRLLQVALAATLTGCGLPPYTIAGSPFTVKYAMFIPKLVAGVPLPTGLPAFADQKAPSSTVDLPQESHSFSLTDLTLSLKLTNTGPLPLQMRVYLASNSTTDIYSTTPLGGYIQLPRGGQEVDLDLSLDPTLISQQKLLLGYTFGSPGTAQSVTFQDGDSVNIDYSLKATVKLF